MEQFYCDYPEVFEDVNDSESRGMHFYKEAKQRFEHEDGRVTIPTIQGYATLLTRYVSLFVASGFANSSSMALMGKDRLVWLSLGQLGRMVADISSYNLPMQLHSDVNKRAEGRAIDNTIWGVYNLTASDHLSTSHLTNAVLRERIIC